MAQHRLIVHSVKREIRYLHKGTSRVILYSKLRPIDCVNTIGVTQQVARVGLRQPRLVWLQ